jgi:glycosyltransferase involved in cell wall biosynthesis
MRIGFDARYINDRYHGIGRYAFELLRALTRLAPEHTFIIFRGKGIDSRFDWRTLETQKNVELRTGPWPLYWPHEQIIWPLSIMRSNLDIFHSPYFVAPLFASSSLPVLITIHDLIFDRYPQYMPQSWGYPYYRLLMRLGTGRARMVLAVSRATAQDLKTYYGVPDDRITVVADGIDLDKWNRLAQSNLLAIRQRYGLSNPFILTVGARRPHKNISRLVEAFSRIMDRVPHDLVMAGPVDRRFTDDAKLIASKLGLNGRVHFLDWVPEADLPALYQLADLVAQPSLIEGFGLPVLEAMASGTAVLAANKSSLPEVVAGAGVLVDPYNVDQIADVIMFTLQSGELRQQLAHLGLQRAKEFSWDYSANQMLKIYQQILA